MADEIGTDERAISSAEEMKLFENLGDAIGLMMDGLVEGGTKIDNIEEAMKSVACNIIYSVRKLKDNPCKDTLLHGLFLAGTVTVLSLIREGKMNDAIEAIVLLAGSHQVFYTNWKGTESILKKSNLADFYEKVKEHESKKYDSKEGE